MTKHGVLDRRVVTVGALWHMWYQPVMIRTTAAMTKVMTKERTPVKVRRLLLPRMAGE